MPTVGRTCLNDPRFGVLDGVVLGTHHATAQPQRWKMRTSGDPAVSADIHIRAWLIGWISRSNTIKLPAPQSSRQL